MMTVGLEINAHHLRPVTTGFVYGVALALQLGRNTQVRDIRISDDNARLLVLPGSPAPAAPTTKPALKH